MAEPKGSQQESETKPDSGHQHDPSQEEDRPGDVPPSPNPETSHSKVDNETKGKFAVQLKSTGFTHVLFFGSGHDWEKVGDLLKAAKKEVGPLEKRGTDDDYPSYGLYHIPVDEPSTKSFRDRASRSIKNTVRRDQYQDKVKDAYRKIVDNYKVNEKDRVGDAICMFGIGEGRKPAFEVAQILSKVGVLQALTFDEDYQQAVKLSKGDANSKQLRNFRSLRSQSAEVGLLCLTGERLDERQLGDNVHICQHDRNDTSHSIENFPSIYKSHFPGPTAQSKKGAGGMSQPVPKQDAADKSTRTPKPSELGGQPSVSGGSTGANKDSL